MKKLILTLFFAFATVCAGAQWTPAINEYHYRAGTVCFRGELINVPAGIPFSCIIDMNGTLHRDMNHTMVIEYLP